MTESEALQLIAQPKSARNWSGFKRRDNHVGHLIGSAILVDQQEITIPGVTIEIEVKAPIVTSRCLLLFTLRHREGKRRPRVYQLEVVPGDKRSHNGEVSLYGPHEHFLELGAVSIQSPEVHCDNWEGCFDWFLKRINIAHFEVERPC
jgi:hypothetical protein